MDLCKGFVANGMSLPSARGAPFVSDRLGRLMPWLLACLAGAPVDRFDARCTSDHVNDFANIRELYTSVDPGYGTGKERFSVPVLYDKLSNTIVSNDGAQRRSSGCSTAS